MEKYEPLMEVLFFLLVNKGVALCNMLKVTEKLFPLVM
jgi:hypothetical protein